MSKENFVPSRRNVLKSIPAATSLTAVGLGSAESIREMEFAEVGITHEFESFPENPDLLSVYEPCWHNVDSNSGKLLLNTEPLSNEKEDYIKSKEQLIWSGEYLSPPTTVLNDTPRRSITASLNARYQRSKAISLVNKYRPPKVDLQWSNGEVSITSKGRHRTISPGEESKLVLPSRKVVVKTDIHPGKQPVRVTPTVHLNNHGSLTLTEVRE